jgi:hypothetical protein
VRFMPGISMKENLRPQRRTGERTKGRFKTGFPKHSRWGS